MRRILIKGRASDGEMEALLIEDNKIIAKNFRSEPPANVIVYDFGEDLLLPGFIDAHVHGGGGFDFVDGTKESFSAIMNLHLIHGTTTVCPTLVSTDWQKTIDFLAFCDSVKDVPGFAGVHLEGPFLSPQKGGAQNPECLILPSKEAAEELLQFKHLLKRVTIAPELPGSEEFCKSLHKEGIGISIGHSAASAETVARAAEWGCNQVTHLFCATSGRFKIGSYVHGGIEESALTDDRYAVELIADGHHVCKESFHLTARCKGTDNIIAVSDAMRAAGCNTNSSFLGERKPENRVIIEDGVAKLPDRSSFAGSVTMGDKMFRVLHHKYGFSVENTVKMMSQTPARILGISSITGTLSPGKIADVAVLKADGSIRTVFRHGQKVI